MNDDDLKRDLKDAYSVTPRDEEQFWTDFKRRASATEQPMPESRWQQLVPPLGMRWALGTVTVAVIAMFVSIRPHFVSAPPVVQSIEISQPFDSYFILEDERNEGTVVWIEGI